YYIHSPYEIPDLSSNYFLVAPSRERDTSFRFLETTASRDLRDLLPRQRHCRFLSEPRPDMITPVYSYNLCRMDCRQRLAFQKCGCAPYFYMQQKDIPVCTVRGLACLSAHVELITTLIKPDGSKYPCPCPLPCRSIEYYVDKDVERDWMLIYVNVDFSSSSPSSYVHRLICDDVADLTPENWSHVRLKGSKNRMWCPKGIMEHKCPTPINNPEVIKPEVSTTLLGVTSWLSLPRTWRTNQKAN
ncbi:hypothetical protein J6590_104628, partial [Homalodisca vitripennis]